MRPSPGREGRCDSTSHVSSRGAGGAEGRRLPHASTARNPNPRQSVRAKILRDMSAPVPRFSDRAAGVLRARRANATSSIRHKGWTARLRDTHQGALGLVRRTAPAHSAPKRLRAARRRNLYPAARRDIRERPYEDLRRAKFVRLIRQPLTVVGDVPVRFRKRRLHVDHLSRSRSTANWPSHGTAGRGDSGFKGHPGGRRPTSRRAGLLDASDSRFVPGEWAVESRAVRVHVGGGEGCRIVSLCCFTSVSTTRHSHDSNRKRKARCCNPGIPMSANIDATALNIPIAIRNAAG